MRPGALPLELFLIVLSIELSHQSLKYWRLLKKFLRLLRKSPGL